MMNHFHRLQNITEYLTDDESFHRLQNITEYLTNDELLSSPIKYY